MKERGDLSKQQDTQQSFDGGPEPPPAEKPPGGQRGDGLASSRLGAARWTQKSSAEALQDLEPAEGGGRSASGSGQGRRAGAAA